MADAPGTHTLVDVTPVSRAELKAITAASIGALPGVVLNATDPVPGNLPAGSVVVKKSA